MTRNCSLMIGMFIVSGPCEVTTITNYDEGQDIYFLESSNGRDKGWMPREAIEAGLLNGSIRQAFPIWMSLARPLGARPGEVIIPSSVSALPNSC